MAGDFSGKVVIVSGAAQGISSIVSQRFAEEGACAVIADIDEERAVARVQDLSARGYDVRFIRTDVRDSSQVNALAERVVRSCGRIDILGARRGRGRSQGDRRVV